MRKILISLLLIVIGFSFHQSVYAQEMCCLPGYSSSWWQCPFGTDRDVNCCARLGLFRYDVKPKVKCESLPENVPESANLVAVCDYASNPQQCRDCIINEDGTSHMWTAIGCVPAEPAGLLQVLLSFGIGIAGGIAFLLIILGGFQMMTSAGSPERLNAGRELITSALTGLILIIFSVFLLRLIGYNILRIPGFGG